MKKYFILLLLTNTLLAQSIKLDKNNLVANQVDISFGKKAVKVAVDTTIKTFDEPTFAKIKGLQFSNGIIEIKVLSRIMKNAPAFARGFIGIAFRIDEKNTQFESIYIRPTNGRADDQIRRNHSIQYFAYPDYKFDRLRKEAPEKYESYADMGLDEWIPLRLEVHGQKAKLYIHNSKQPALIVNDLKLGDTTSGTIGLWVGNYTEGYFKDLKVTKSDER